MKTFYAYIRVSTVKQGQTGVSLDEQRAAIEAYAKRHGLAISEWFEEQLTAAKRGRPAFLAMLTGLRRGLARGVIIHKIDRSARNLRDWADLGDLIDGGVAVHFANESLDLHSRGGRLAADIQAIVAADFIRNLREETLKGLNGRLKQGLYPFCAPLGYLDKGKGNLKEIDTLKGPQVQEAFQLYATGAYSLESLVNELYKRGLRNARAGKVTRAGLSKMFNNPFYIGLMRVKTTGTIHRGNHAPLISPDLFERVQAQLKRGRKVKTRTHDFLFRGLFRCTVCKRHLIGETHKGFVYYRCHEKGCPSGCFREEALDTALQRAWTPFAVTDAWKLRLSGVLDSVLSAEGNSEAERKSQLRAQIGAAKSRLDRVTDAFVDGALDKASYESRRRTLLEEENRLVAALEGDAISSARIRSFVLETLELAIMAQRSYRLANSAEKREMAILLSSNRTVTGKCASVEPYFPFHIMAKRPAVSNGDHLRNGCRTSVEAAKRLCEWAKKELQTPRGENLHRPLQ